jgi:hypothetical protein
MSRTLHWVRFRTEKAVCFPYHTAIFGGVDARLRGESMASISEHIADIFRAI